MRRWRAAGGFFYTLFLFHTFPLSSYLILYNPKYHQPILILKWLKASQDQYADAFWMCVFFFWLISKFDWLTLVGSISQAGFANLHLRLCAAVCVMKHTMSGGKAKVLSKKPSRTFVSIKPRVSLKAIHHDRNEHNTLPAAWPPRLVLQWTCEDLCHERSEGVVHVY